MHGFIIFTFITFTGLSHVSAGWDSTNNNLVNIFGNKLQFLLHGNSPNSSIDFSNINFINLEQVTIY